MAVPVWATNQVLLASDVNNWFVPIAAYKSSNTSRTSTSLSVDPDLTMSVAASSVYEVHGVLNYQNATGSGAFDWMFNVPSGATGAYAAAYNQPGPTYNSWGNTWGLTAKAATGDNLSHGIVLEGTLITSSAGTFSLSWCLDATGGAVALNTGSHLIVRRIS